MQSLAAEYRRYLRLLGIDCGVPAGLPGLERIVKAHLCRVPFENVSKLQLLDAEGAGRITTLPEFLDGIEHRDLGGTCYTNNPYLAELLRAVGYDADLLGADMENPNVHTSVRVRIDGAEYHVDVGYAAPFREPMRLDRLPLEFESGQSRYVLDRDGAGGRHAMNVYQGGERVHGYVVHQPPRALEFFRPIIVDSYGRGRMFTSTLWIVRFFDDGVAALKGTQLAVHRGGVHTEAEMRSFADLERAVAESLEMPRCPVVRAAEILERITGKPFFAQ